MRALQTKLDELIVRMRELNQRFPNYPSVEIEWRVARSMYIALNCRSNDRKDIATWRARALAAAEATGDKRIRYNMMAHVVVTALHDAEFALARELLAALPSPELSVGANFLGRR